MKVNEKLDTTIKHRNNLESMAGRKEILCDGYFYDVTEFISKHPGGTVIEYYTEKGEDGTHAIQQFHQRSIKRVNIMMRSFKRRKAADHEIGLDDAVLKKNRALTEDFTKLYLDLESQGYFEPSYIYAASRIIELIAMAVVGYILLCSHNIVTKVIGIALIGITKGRSGYLAHEIGHYSFTGIPSLDRIFCSLVDGLGVGLSGSRWRRQHNRHHAMPQRLHHDVDLDTMPLLAYNEIVVKNSKDGNSFMIQNQAYLFLMDTLLVGLIWKVYQDPKFVFKRRCYLEIASMSGHWFLLYNMGFWPFFFSTWIGTIFLFGNFSLNHTFLPVTTEPNHWVEYSLIHTADVDPRRWCNWWMGYLNYQIEHHLFPTLPNFRLPLIKDRVKALADKHNIPYIVQSYPGAWKTMLKNLSDVAKKVKHL